MPNRYVPETAAVPGEILQEMLDERGMDQADLAARTGRPRKTINEIIHGKAAITAETALQLERVLGVPAAFWNNLEAQYRESEARAKEGERLLDSTSWLKMLPLGEMLKRNVIRERQDAVQQIREALAFFGVASPDQWEAVFATPQAAFRKSAVFETDVGSLALWLRLGELKAQAIECAAFDKEGFARQLDDIRRLTLLGVDEFEAKLVEACAPVGVAVVFVDETPGSRVCGAARWLSPTKALIQLSYRYKRLDYLWFAFFHEAAHILLHGKKETFLDSHDKSVASDQEDEANAFAARTLIPAADLRRLLARPITAASIRAFARDIGIAPGIVVGRLQHDGQIPFSQFNEMRVKLPARRT